MVALNSHKLLHQSTLFCSEMSYLDVQKRAWFEIKQIYLHFLFDYLFAKVKNKAMSSGNFKTKSSGSRMRGSWKLTEIKLAKKKKMN